jgi:hypothetical protein
MLPWHSEPDSGVPYTWSLYGSNGMPCSCVVHQQIHDQQQLPSLASC